MDHQTFELLSLILSGCAALAFWLFGFVLSGIRTNQTNLWAKVAEHSEEIATIKATCIAFGHYKSS